MSVASVARSLKTEVRAASVLGRRGFIVHTTGGDTHSYAFLSEDEGFSPRLFWSIPDLLHQLGARMAIAYSCGAGRSDGAGGADARAK